MADGYTSVASRTRRVRFRGEVVRGELGCGAACESQVWEHKIQVAVEESQDAVIFADGSRGEDGTVAGGWSKDSFEAGKYPGEGATVWDGEVAGMAEALERGPRDRGVLILPCGNPGEWEGRRTR